MSPIAEKIESEKENPTENSGQSMLRIRENKYLHSWANKTNLREMNEVRVHGEGDVEPSTTLDKLREETESLGERRGWGDRVTVAIALDAITEGTDEDVVNQIDPLIDGFHDFVTREVDSSIAKEVIVEEFIDSCRDIADAPEEVFEEIEQGDPKKGMAAVVDLLSDKISEIASRKKRVRIKHAIAKKAVSGQISVAV
ncbi:hypothetical protein KC939_02150 [Candidatus Saccharibacteria bacterium]|nr:hypothetical protein [Candidatus Saccharibacteria bacterium]